MQLYTTVVLTMTIKDLYSSFSGYSPLLKHRQHRDYKKMKILKLSFALFAGLMLSAVSILGQTKFSDPNVEYEFVLPEKEWKMTVTPSEYSPNVEYVYRDKREGHLEIRKLTVDPEDLFSDVIRDEEQKLQFKPGYVAGKEENFRGAMTGKVFNFEYVRSGRNYSGRFYFLRENLTTIFVVRFTGLKDTLRTIRNQTDYIARTFKKKKS